MRQSFNFVGMKYFGFLDCKIFLTAGYLVGFKIHTYKDIP